MGAFKDSHRKEELIISLTTYNNTLCVCVCLQFFLLFFLFLEHLEIALEVVKTAKLSGVCFITDTI